MYALAWIAMLCAFLGVLFALVSFGLHPGLGRRVGFTSSVSLILVCVVILGGLALARQPICEALGGSWNRNGPDESCFNEWGGNGDNETNAPKARTLAATSKLGLRCPSTERRMQGSDPGGI